MGKDHYETLRVDRDADLAAIRAAYRARIKASHPDATHTDETTEEFRRAREAFETLSDAGRRTVYDREVQASRDSRRRAASCRRTRRCAAVAQAEDIE